MKRYAAFPLLTLLGGAGSFALRLLYNRTGFEPDTGLPVPGCPYAWALPLTLAALAAALLLLSCSLPGERGETPRRFQDYFSSSGAALPALLVTGIFLWIFSGAWAVYSAVLSGGSRLEMLLGILTVLTAACLFPVVAACRSGEKPLNGNLLLAPVIYLVIRLVLAYRTDSINPALGAYYIELLALVFLILAFYRASSFAFHCGRTRRFSVYAGLAVVFGIATLADGHSVSAALLYGGAVVLVMGFLLLRLEAAGRESTPADGGRENPRTES